MQTPTRFAATASALLLSASLHAADLQIIDWYQTADVIPTPGLGTSYGTLADNGDGTYSGDVYLYYYGWPEFGAEMEWQGTLTYNIADHSLTATNVSCVNTVVGFLDICAAYLTEGRSTLDATAETPTPWMVRVDNATGFNLEWHTSDAVGVVFHYGFAEVPVPAAAWLFGSALAGLGFARRRLHAN